MHVYLPLDTHATAIDDFIDTLSAETIQTVMSVRKLTEVDVEIPKMSLENTYTLNNVSFEANCSQKQENFLINMNSNKTILRMNSITLLGFEKSWNFEFVRW